MVPFRRRLLLFSTLFCVACASEYKALLPVEADTDCIRKITPKSLSTSWYTASVDVVGKHISGLLFVKNQGAGSYRTVFMNEAGVKFLDFEFSDGGGFKVHHVMNQLDKKAVINLLRSDFELLLSIPFREKTLKEWSLDDKRYFGVEHRGDRHFLVTDNNCSELLFVESASKRKRKVTLKFYGQDLQSPDSARLSHHTFNMQMFLKKIDRD